MSNKYIMPILDKNELEGIDNNKATWESIALKVEEEAIEVLKAIKNNDMDNIGEELHDLIQISITALGKLKSQNNDILEFNQRHNEKLKGREWTYKGVLEIQLKELGGNENGKHD